MNNEIFQVIPEKERLQALGFRLSWTILTLRVSSGLLGLPVILPGNGPQTLHRTCSPERPGGRIPRNRCRGRVCSSPVTFISVPSFQETPVSREAALGGQADPLLRPGEGLGKALQRKPVRCLLELQQIWLMAEAPCPGAVLHAWWGCPGNRHLAFGEHPL